MKMTQQPLVHHRKIILMAISITSLLFPGYSLITHAQQESKVQRSVQTPWQRQTTQVANPCRFAAESTACFNYKIERLKATVESLEEKLNQLEQKQTLGPPIEGLPSQGDKADGATDAAIRNLQTQLDTLWDRVSKLIDRAARK